MATSRVTYTGDGSTTTYGIPFSYISRAHVTVKLNTIPVLSPGWWTWTSDSVIEFNNPPSDGVTILIERNTPIEDRLVEFQNGAVLTEEELNLAVSQLLFRLQETDDFFRSALDDGLERVNNGQAVSAQEAIDAIVQEIVESDALADLQQRYADIGLNAESILSETDARVAALQQEIQDRISGDSGLQSQLNTLAQATAGTVYVQATAPVPGVDGVPDPIQDYARWYDSDDNNKPYIWDGTGWLAIEDPRIAQNESEIAAANARISDAEGDILANASSINVVDATVLDIDGRLVAAAGDITTLEAAVNDPTTGLSALNTAVGGLSTEITSIDGVLTSTVGDVTVLENAVNDPLTGLSAINTAIGGLNTEIQALDGEITSVSSDLTLLTNTVTDPVSGLSAAFTAIGGLDTRIEANEDGLTAVGSDLTSITLVVNDPVTGLAATKTLVDGVQGEVNILDGEVSANSSAITSIQDTVNDPITGLSATAGALNSLETEVTNQGGELTATTEGLNALTATIEDPVTGLAKTRADLSEEVTLRATETSALSETISLLGAETEDGTAFILDTNTAKVSPGESMAERFTQLQAGIDSKATITQWQEVRDDADELYAKAGLQLDVNGHIIGWALNNDGDSGDMVITADKFSIVDPSDPNNSIVPFVVTGGVVYMNDIIVGNAQIDNLELGKLIDGDFNANATVNGDLEMADGRIIFDNGTYLKAQGVGFGGTNNSEFIEWFGPRPAGGDLSLCTAANAIWYIKTNGDTYFGGSLSAGVLKTAAQTTSLASDAEVETAAFGTNGNPKTVTVSYTAIATPLDSATDVSSSNAGTASIVLERSINGGSSWTQVGSTFSVTGTVSCLWNGGEPGLPEYTCARSAGGSFTVTDSETSTNDFIYRVRLTSRSFSFNSMINSQTLSVISVEE